MDHPTKLTEPLRITDSSNYELYDYFEHNEIAFTEALLLGNSIETDLNTTLKVINKKNNTEVDRIMLKAFINPTQPLKDKITLKGKFFNPKNHFLKVETKETTDDIHFLLYFSKYN